VLYGAGLRRAEVIALDVTDFDPESGELPIRSGQGRKARMAYVTNEAHEAVTAWLGVRGGGGGACHGVTGPLMGLIVHGLVCLFCARFSGRHRSAWW
jgi:integrase